MSVLKGRSCSHARHQGYFARHLHAAFMSFLSFSCLGSREVGVRFLSYLWWGCPPSHPTPEGSHFRCLFVGLYPWRWLGSQWVHKAEACLLWRGELFNWKGVHMQENEVTKPQNGRMGCTILYCWNGGSALPFMSLTCWFSTCKELPIGYRWIQAC